MSECAYTIFETPIGRCAIIWRGDQVVGASLPAPTEAQLKSRLERSFPGAVQSTPPAWVEKVEASVVRLLSGEPEAFEEAPLDLTALADFERRVLELTRQIPVGQTRTYGEIAAALGAPGAARAVGRALGANPIPIIIPCHRVLAAGGKSGGFSAPGGASTKLKILEIEGARRGGELELFDRLPWAMRPVT